MKMFVITIEDHELSNKYAERCIESAKKFGHTVEKWKAVTPKHEPFSLLKQEGISPLGFEEEYSRLENCISAFLSHYSLWKKCIELNENILVLEHDAYFNDAVPDVPFQDICNFGQPSYGKFITPPNLGLNPLTSKRYLPGAHAYGVTPNGSNLLVQQSKLHARPTDLFIRLETFTRIQEYYPWPVEARDAFSTIQNERGCLAKHRYNEDYKLL